MSGRTLITGIGVAAPSGLGVEDFWAATRIGKNAIGPVTRFDASSFPARLAGEVHGFEAGDHLPGRLVPQTDRVTQLALIATDCAFADAGIAPGDVHPCDMGVVTAAGSGGLEFGERELRKLWSQGARHVSAYQSFAWFYAVNSGQIAVRNDLRGPAGVVVGDQAGGLEAFSYARRRIGKGSRLIATGGFDASVCSFGWAAHLAGGTLSLSDQAERAYLPFDGAASGYVPGEGGAIVVLEDEDSVRARGGRNVYGEFAGYAATFDPRPGSGREPGLRRALEGALADAGCHPDEVDVVFADGAGVVDLDRVEAEAVTAVFGPRRVPVTVPKTMTGRLGAGGAPVDMVSAVLAMREGLIPPTTNVELSPAYDIDLVTGRSRTASVRTALVLARGHGGFNSAAVLRAVD
ncbi:ketosynthase chain-length factor [Streptomyces lavendulae]|uniref:ketosynthase chain-length factor n=1 Tax=Streptomyces lavendulae TaxID=1914 RepID=UPI0024A01ECC|nr:ketosynthase chain-length factor [Streptomyces lavendulae]GLX23104.1 actinorhodin polyketide putative beta-ketoacyl synthase 2 [Streptomyces lavendulae subsp. lavendulae]GLX30566.1 actinorhodin polyketide putative beta-ketoacyl synthase 2 [Streptomyces lavendulae subsp. lavendulae]